MLLEVRDLVTGYQKKPVLRGVSLQVDAGEIVALIGHNGAGKTTTLKSIMGLMKAQRGTIHYQNASITNREPDKNVREGISLVPQGHPVFSDLSVLENLELGAYTLAEGSRVLRQRMDQVFDFFPILNQRRHQQAGSLSGGMQQMLALGMAWMLTPKLLLLDEPSLGLAPLVVQNVLESVREINARFGTAVLLVEQNVKQALRVAQRVYVMKVGQIALADSAANVLNQEQLWHLF